MPLPPSSNGGPNHLSDIRRITDIMRAVDFRSYKKPTEVKKFIDILMNERLKGTGLTASSAMFLIELEPGLTLSNQNLARRVGVTMALSTRVTRQLQEMGLVQNESRGRSCAIHLTPDGESLRMVVIGYAEECLEYLFADFTDDEISQMERFYGKIDARIDLYWKNHDGYSPDDERRDDPFMPRCCTDLQPIKYRDRMDDPN